MEIFRRMFGLKPPPTERRHPKQEDSFNMDVSKEDFNFLELQIFDEMERITNHMFKNFGLLEPGYAGSNIDPNHPRHQLLKEPDSEGTSILERPKHSQDHEQFFKLDQEPLHPFTFMDKFMKEFGLGNLVNPSIEPGYPYNDSKDSSRNLMLKRDDEDLDDKVSAGDISKLLKEGPTYEGDCSLQHSPQQMRSGFKSTTVTRVVRPDGTIEERRTYKDSSGKEEVTVTEIEPGAKPLLPNEGSIFGGSSGLFLFRGKL